MSPHQSLVERIHASRRQLVLAITGGGSGAIAALLEVPGASATVLEVVIPYAATALQDWLGGPPDQYCSERTARAMAMAAFERARILSDADPLTLRGIGSTASLASTRQKRGAHRIHVAWQSADTTVVTSCTFPSESTREEEEHASAQLILEAVAESCAVERFAPKWTIGKTNERREHHAPPEWTELLLGERQSVAPTPPNTESPAVVSDAKLVFPGAFNPLHRAHKRMAEIAAERYRVPVTFELSITNVAKPALDFVEISDRIAQFQGRRVLLTRAETFVEKVGITPGCVFVVGVDTLARIGEPAFYGDYAVLRDDAIQCIANYGCRFLVFGRTIDSRFYRLSDFRIPPALRALCDEVPESDFREDVSSTELRGA